MNELSLTLTEREISAMMRGLSKLTIEEAGADYTSISQKVQAAAKGVHDAQQAPTLKAVADNDAGAAAMTGTDHS